MEDMFMCIMIINTAMSVTKIRRKKTRWVFRERQEAGDFTQLILKAKQLGDAFTFREFLRMTPASFEELLRLCGPLIKNVLGL